MPSDYSAGGAANQPKEVDLYSLRQFLLRYASQKCDPFARWCPPWTPEEPGWDVLGAHPGPLLRAALLPHLALPAVGEAAQKAAKPSPCAPFGR